MKIRNTFVTLAFLASATAVIAQTAQPVAQPIVVKPIAPAAGAISNKTETIVPAGTVVQPMPKKTNDPINVVPAGTVVQPMPKKTDEMPKVTTPVVVVPARP